MGKILLRASILSLLLFNAPLYALDTDIFVGGEVAVPPNVLIILDTSATMKDPNLLVHGKPYSPGTTYTAKKIGSVTPKKGSVYYSKNEFKETEKLLLVEITTTDNVNLCSTAKTALTTTGMYIGKINKTDFTCTGEAEVFYDGNYLNYLTSTNIAGDEYELRQKAARGAILDLVGSNEISNARFGIMGFDNIKIDGGNVVLPCGATNEQFQTQLLDESNTNPLDSVGSTPLAETLAEAGLYFTGGSRWANYQKIPNPGIFITGSETKYKSPIEYRCQKNFIILITDGMSTKDMGIASNGGNGALGDGYDIFRNNYINSKKLSAQSYVVGDTDDLNADGTVRDLDPDKESTHMLDDVAKFLHDEDLLISGEDSVGGSFENANDPKLDKQFISTYTIGFMTSTATTTGVVDNQIDTLLQKTATAGGGVFLKANNRAQLIEALKHAFALIMEANSSFVAPVVPVNKLNRVYSGNSVYLSLFKPVDQSAFWLGNIKKFGITSNAVLLQKNGSPAVDSNDVILDSATSCWPNSDNDGSEVDKGGAGKMLLTDDAVTNRKFYINPTTGSTLLDFYNTYYVDSTVLRDSSNLNVSTYDEQKDVLNYVTAKGVYSPHTSNESTSKRDWVLGDILHSKPATMLLGDKTVIFVGANDGFLHAFVDDDGGTAQYSAGTLCSEGAESCFADDTVSELWSFVPRSLLPNLKNLKGSSHNTFYVDGSPVIYDAGDYRYLTFGLRRGGTSYYTLNLGSLTNGVYPEDSVGYEDPSFAWELKYNVFGDGGEPLGQSWGRPWVSTIATSAAERKKVLILSGGYDDIEDDPSPGTNTKGRAVFAYDPVGKAVINNLNFTAMNTDDISITHCIVELMAFDRNSNGVDETVYAGSMGGELFAFRDFNEDGEWAPRYVFQGGDNTDATAHLKFFYEPDVALERFGDYAYIGTGDRENPTEHATVNRFYAIKHNWSTSTGTTPLTETNLKDVTTCAYTNDDIAEFKDPDVRGWFIKLATGEKVMSAALVFNKKVFFTTYTPVIPVSGMDLCAVKSLGRGKLYALDYLTGKAALNLNKGNDPVDPSLPRVIDNSDRSTDLGSGIPSAPTLIVTKDGGSKLLIATGVDEGDSSSGGTDGEIKVGDYETGEESSSNLFYWIQK